MQAVTRFGIRPVRWGTPVSAPSALLVQVVGEDGVLDYTLLRDHASYGECGAVVTFEGVVRATEDGRPLEALDYEHHAQMAQTELEKVCAEALERFDVARIACVHRVGRVAVGEASVVVMVGADHRAAAFDACRHVIDALKRTVPIWKAPAFAGPEGPPDSREEVARSGA